MCEKAGEQEQVAKQCRQQGDNPQHGEDTMIASFTY